eukprot:1887466-Prymnesium_polylepis.1
MDMVADPPTQFNTVEHGPCPNSSSFIRASSRLALSFLMQTQAEVPAILPAIAAKVNLPKMGAGAFAYSKLQTRHATLLNSQELTLETDAR